MPYIYKSGLQFGINETNIYGGASYVELTQAEYNALSDAEKHNGQIYFITDGNYDFLIVNDSVPVGSIQAYGGMTAPTNWLICDGSAVSRTDYSELFQAVGITYGAGDGSTTFNLPDLRGRVAIGQSTTYGLGASGGNETHTHGLSDGYAKLTSASTALRWDYKSVPSYATRWQMTCTSPTSTNATASDGITLGGNTNSASNMQPYVVTNYIIKAKNPSITSGQQLQAMELFYPVGSYYETSDSTFDPNVEWGGTWEVEAKQVYRAAWTATSTNANNVKVTDSLILPKGTYIISIKIPVCSQENPIGFATNLGLETGGLFAHGQSILTSIITLNSETTIYAETNMSQATTYTYIERGYLKAVPISLGDGIKWHRTA